MMRGAHVLLYSTDVPADRAFFRDVLEFPYVDDGDGWLIFKLPAAEMGIHPSDGSFQQRHGDVAIAGSVLYLMCDNIREMVHSLQSSGTNCASLADQECGISTTLTLPSGGRIGLYQPKTQTGHRWQTRALSHARIGDAMLHERVLASGGDALVRTLGRRSQKRSVSWTAQDTTRTQ